MSNPRGFTVVTEENLPNNGCFLRVKVTDKTVTLRSIYQSLIDDSWINHYPQIKNGLITYRENSNVIIITFNNVYLSEPISSGVLTLAGTGVYLKYQTDTMPSQTNKEDGKAGMMFMSALGSIEIRVPSLGTYAG